MCGAKVACTTTGTFGIVKLPSEAMVTLPSDGLVTFHPVKLYPVAAVSLRVTLVPASALVSEAVAVP